MKFVRSYVTGIGLFLSITLFSACWSGERVKGSGPVVTKEVSVGEFHTIHTDGALDVMLVRKDGRYVSVEAQANIAELLRAEVRNGVLHLSTTGSYSTDKPFIVHIEVPQLDGIEVIGSGDVKSSDIFTATAFRVEIEGSGDVEIGVRAQTVTANVSGSGEVKLNGTCSTLQAVVLGSGDVKAGSLIAGNTSAKVTGSGDITVQTTGHLEADVTGSGDVKYKGEPGSITEHVTGSGEVKATKE